MLIVLGAGLARSLAADHDAPSTQRASVPRPLLLLDFDSPLPADARLSPGARLVPGRRGKGILSSQLGEPAVAMPPAGRLCLARGTVVMWIRPVEPFGAGKTAAEGNLVGLDPNKIFNTFLRAPGGPRLRAETFDAAGEYHGTLFEYVRLKPERWYHFAFTWDSTTGKVRQYLNAALQSAADGAPWQPKPLTGRLIIGHPQVVLDDVAIYAKPLTQAQIGALAGLEPGQGLRDEGIVEYDIVVDWPRESWELIYENAFRSPDDIGGWRMEGPGEARIVNGRLLLRSRRPPKGHIVFWAPVTVPGDFMMAWDFEAAAPQGLFICFFCAAGKNGQDIFHESLAPRSGAFSQYVRGDIRAYHVSYYRNRGAVTGICNLRKDPGMTLLAIGRDPIPPRPGGIHRIQLLKSGDTIALAIDGKLVLRGRDDQADGQAVWGAGQVGFRQMAPGQAYYDNLRIYALH